MLKRESSHFYSYDPFDNLYYLIKISRNGIDIEITQTSIETGKIIGRFKKRENSAIHLITAYMGDSTYGIDTGEETLFINQFRILKERGSDQYLKLFFNDTELNLQELEDAYREKNKKTEQAEIDDLLAGADPNYIESMFETEADYRDLYSNLMQFDKLVLS